MTSASGKRDLIGQFGGTFEALFHTQRVHGERTIVGYAMSFTRCP